MVEPAHRETGSGAVLRLVGAEDEGAPSADPARDPAVVAEEGALVRRVLAGDVEAFNGLVRRHLRRAFALAHRILGHREDAEDLVQDAFVTALAQLERFDPTRPFAPWLGRIVVTRALNARAARARRAAEPIDLVGELPDGSPDAAPGLAAERDEIRRRFRTALAALPERQRLIVELVDVEGFAPAEVAALLDLAAPTARWHLHQARQALRAALAPLRDGADARDGKRERGTDDAS